MRVSAVGWFFDKLEETERVCRNFPRIFNQILEDVRKKTDYGKICRISE